jgi:2-polyprenyl-3-methyl-5-hydroxy-6-metoxy-1,4-benzoquinol methylase
VPSIAENKYWWEAKDWAEAGNEWSLPYGTPAMQWYASLLPRIHSYLPVPTILEIAPGFGRWTQYLKDLCSQLVLVDLSAKCLEGCKQRFDSEKHITYHQTDGKSLSMVEDNSIDFMFSFDSLVHADMDVIQAYLEQLANKLTPNGVGFIHHSNLGSFLPHFEFAEKLPRGRNLLSKMRVVEPGDHKRSKSMTADLFVSLATDAGLKVITQEVVNWGTQRPIDCMSVFTRPGGARDRDFKRWVNEDFDREAAYIRKLADMYDRGQHSTPNVS